jgi:hypothetical protein
VAPKKKPKVSAAFAEVTASHRARLERVAGGGNLKRLKKLYTAAQAELEAKLRRAVGRARGDTFSALQHRQLLVQVREGQAQISQMMAGQLGNLSWQAQAEALDGLSQDIGRLEQAFTGAEISLPTEEASVFAGVIQGRRQSLLEQHASSMSAWGRGTIDSVQEGMALSLATGETTDDAIDRIQQVTHGEFWKAERIVRTETSWAFSAATSDGIDAAADELGDIYQRWSELCDDESGAPLDDRVGVDSIAMHGQVAAPGGAFTMPATAPVPDHKGKMVVPASLIGKSWPYPPNRPNDRSVLQAWRPEWGIPGWILSGGARVPFTLEMLPPRKIKRSQNGGAPQPSAPFTITDFGDGAPAE